MCLYGPIQFTNKERIVTRQKQRNTNNLNLLLEWSEFSRKTTAIKEGWYKNQLKLDRIIYWYGSIVAAPGAHERDFRSFRCLKIPFPGNHSRDFIYQLFILIVCSNNIASQNYEFGLILFSWRNYIYLIFISETNIITVLSFFLLYSCVFIMY